MSKLTIKFTYYTEDSDDPDGGDVEVEAELPAKYEVCDRCEGHGMHLNPNIGGHAYTMEEFNESFDEEEAEQYFTRGGMYDVTCEECHGNKVVPVVDEEHCDPALLKRYQDDMADQAADREQDRYTRWMENGGRDDY